MRRNNFDVIDHTLASTLGASAMARFLRARGERMKGAPLRDPFTRMAPRQCFRNAASVALEFGLKYFEGYGWLEEFGPVPFEHAWCVDPDTRAVVDVTWECPEKAVYLGVFVETPLLMQIMLDSGVCGVLDHGKGFAYQTVAQHFGWAPERQNASARLPDPRNAVARKHKRRLVGSERPPSSSRSDEPLAF